MSDQISTARLRDGKSAGARLGGFIKDGGYVWLAFFASAALMLFMMFCNQMIPFGGRTILRMDLYHQYGPLFAELYERLVGGRSLLYSWNTGLGGGFLGNFFNYLSSPTGLLVLLFGHENVPEAISVMVLLKCAFASGAFAHMLRKVHGKNDASIAAFGILYSFCSFFIAYYWNVMWIDAMALLPLVMLGVHNIIHKRKFMLYSVTLGITLMTSYYMGFMVCIFSVLFFVVTYFSDYEFSSKLPPAAEGQKTGLKNNRMLRTGLMFGYASALAGALAAFSLLPVYFALKSSSATSGEFTDSIGSYFTIFDFLANHFADVVPTIRSSGEDVLPNVYSGVAAILLVPLYLLAPKIKGREKIAHVLLLLFMYFSFNTNILNYVWHALHFPNDLPYRFSFLYSFLLLWVAYKVFINLRHIPMKAIVGVGAFAALFAVIVEKIGSKNVDVVETLANGTEIKHATTLITLAFIAAYTLVFIAMRRTPKAKAASLTMLMLCCVVTEVCAADVRNFEITQLKTNYTPDLADFQTMQSKLYESDESFFRMELTDLRTRMDPAWYDYPGISTFSSMAYERTSNLQSRLGLGSNFINSYTYNPNTPVYNAMHNLKYLVENQNFEGGSGSSYLPVLDNSPFYTRRGEFTQGRFTVFENDYNLPIAFWADDALRGWDTVSGSDPFRKQGDFWALAGAGEGVFNRLNLRLSENFVGEAGMEAYTNENYVGYSNKPERADREPPVGISFFIDVEETQNVYIHVDGPHAFVRVNTLNDGVLERSHDHQTVWDLGVVTPEQPLSVDIYPGNGAPASGGFYVYAYGLNEAVFVEGYESLNKGALQMSTGRESETLLKGTITAPRDGLLYTSIPYDEGWRVEIDGKRVPVSEYVGLGNKDDYPIPGMVKLLTRLRGTSTSGGRFTQWLDRRIEILESKEQEPIKGGVLGVPVSAGKHEISLRYVPRGFYGGVMISAAALILLALSGLLGELLRRRREEEGEFVPTPPVPESTSLFGTAHLRPEDFSLDAWSEPTAEASALPPMEAPPAFPAGEEEEETFQLHLPEEPEDSLPEVPEDAPAEEPEETPANAGSAGINAILQEMQARAEELRRKMQLEPEPPDDDEPSFKLV